MEEIAMYKEKLIEEKKKTDCGKSGQNGNTRCNERY